MINLNMQLRVSQLLISNIPQKYHAKKSLPLEFFQNKEALFNVAYLDPTKPQTDVNKLNKLKPEKSLKEPISASY